MWTEFNGYNSVDYRAKQRGKIIPYGIDYLDKALGGIRSTDLIFIGAKTGAGKTELATILAQNISSLGKNVYYFALEADRGEIETRIVFREFAKLYYANKYFKHTPPINYRDFADGKYDSQDMLLIEQAIKNTNKKVTNVNILYRQKNFTADDFEAQVQNIKDYADVIILDHIHHFDVDTDRETQELKKIVKRARDLNIMIEKPILCIAHFRKSERKTQELVPNLEEFYGSSEISKEATQIITLAPIPPELIQEDIPYNISPTLFRIPKFRRFSPVCKYVGLMKYDSNSNTYLKGFRLFTLIKNGQELLPVDDLPDYLENKKIREVQGEIMA